MIDRRALIRTGFGAAMSVASFPVIAIAGNTAVDPTRTASEESPPADSPTTIEFAIDIPSIRSLGPPPGLTEHLQMVLDNIPALANGTITTVRGGGLLSGSATPAAIVAIRGQFDESALETELSEVILAQSSERVTGASSNQPLTFHSDTHPSGESRLVLSYGNIGDGRSAIDTEKWWSVDSDRQFVRNSPISAFHPAQSGGEGAVIELEFGTTGIQSLLPDRMETDILPDQTGSAIRAIGVSILSFEESIDLTCHLVSSSESEMVRSILQNVEHHTNRTVLTRPPVIHVEDGNGTITFGVRREAFWHLYPQYWMSDWIPEASEIDPSPTSTGQ